MSPRPDQFADSTADPSAGRPCAGSEPGGGHEAASHRLNLLLSHGGWRVGSTVDQLPCLLEPMGIRTLRAQSGEEAADVIRTYRIHIAVVDLAIPLQKAAQSAQTVSGAAGIARPQEGAGGPRILQLLRRLDQPPPTVVLRPPQPIARDNARLLADALREGAFAVIDWPVNLEVMLEVMRRILHRHYSGSWPAA